MTAHPIDVDRAAVAALGGLPAVGPGRLRALVGTGGPAAAWSRVLAGTVEVDEALAAACAGADVRALLADWRAAATSCSLAAVSEAHAAAGVEVLLPGDEAWPAALVDDPDPPSALYVLGSPGVLAHGTAVAVVGTRRATRYGIGVARRFGEELASSGVMVVSGLAGGIDGAAHVGALAAGVRSGAAPVLGVVGTGLDVVYPSRHRLLWDRVATEGALISEWPLGTTPTRWRFPARNRIIAALADAVVVVESPSTGGSLHTVDEAARRDRPVLAVPGPITSPTSAGTNRLLADGAAPACDADDLLLAVGLGHRPGAAVAVEVPDGDAGRLLDAFGWRPATLDELVGRSGLGLEVVARSLATLVADGWVAADGGWYERCR